MRISIDDLHAFEAVARLSSFARAAEELALTQSALSRRVSKLEEELGVRLLDRTTRQVSVSTMGEQVLAEARRALNDYDRSVREMADLVKGRQGVVSFASNMTISETLLPDIVAAFRERQPGVRLRIREGSSPAARQQVLRKEAELAMCQLGDEHADLENELLFEDRFVVICHKDHPVASATELKWSDLEGHDFIRMQPGSGTIDRLQQKLGTQWSRLSGSLEVSHFHALLAMVGLNLGISAVPTLMKLRRTDLDLVSVPVTQPIVSRNLGLVSLRGHSLSPGAEVLRQVCRDVMVGKAKQANP